MFHEAKPPVLEADSGVALTAVSDPKPTMVPATPSTPSVPAAGKTEAKSLADLEAEVFKKLNVSVPKATKVYRGPSPGSSSGSGSANASIEAAPIPDLSPATTR